MDSFNHMIFITAFAIGEILEVVARKVWRVRLDALSSESLGLLPSSYQDCLLASNTPPTAKGDVSWECASRA